jgi:hypothetical protein
LQAFNLEEKLQSLKIVEKLYYRHESKWTMLKFSFQALENLEACSQRLASQIKSITFSVVAGSKHN